jgi:ATP-dependent Clp protease ATP-binding subunit ClpA
VFERFTDRSRRVMVLAQGEALNHKFVGTEHLLLGLLEEGEGVAARALELLSIDVERVRAKVEETGGPAGGSTSSPPSFSPRAKKVLDLSLREALQLGHNYIGTEHLLLGLVREGEGVAVKVLLSLGADLTRVRQQVIELLSGYPSPETLARRPAAAAARSPRAVRRDGPRCPGCRGRLAGHIGYRILPVPPVDDGSASEQGRAADPILVVFVYCLQCGVVIAHAPADGSTDGL